MHTDGSHQISILIDEKLSGLSSDIANEHRIFKVNAALRSQSEEAYEPQMLSIGPYHQGKENLQEVETYKLRYLYELLHRRGESSAERYIIALTQLEDRARRCYAEKISLSKDDFVKMMCLDGCFIIEFLRKIRYPELQNRDDPIFQMVWLKLSLIRDPILFENQLPFFVLEELFNMTKFPGQKEGLIDLATSALNRLSPSIYTYYKAVVDLPPSGVIHLLDLMHKTWCSTFSTTTTTQHKFLQEEDIVDSCSLLELKKSASEKDEQSKSWFSLIMKKKGGVHDIPTPNRMVVPGIQLIKSARELQESGIKLEKYEDSKSWLDVTFDNGKIKIPPLSIEDHTESVFRNLIALEEFYTSRSPKPYETRRCVVDYVTVMDLLIDCSKDVEKLCHGQVNDNWIGSDEAVCTLFNKLGIYVTIVPSKFCYNKVFKQVNEYSCKPWNIWVANLMKNYFNSPWAIVSFVAALLLLILTATQTVFTILEYAKQQGGRLGRYLSRAIL